MRLNRNARTIYLKIVYYGPGMCGKTTNLMKLFALAPPERRGELVTLDTETERTLFFDYFPLNGGTLANHTVKFDFFTVPGQSFYAATRAAVLDGADGIVFVADSDPDREEANIISHEDMIRTLRERGRDPDNIPRVYQWNKRDLKRTIPVAALERALNPSRFPSVEAVATLGVGVQEAQEMVINWVLERLHSGSRSAREAAPHA